MAIKVFRIHTGGVENESGWFNSAPFSSTQLDTIITNNKTVASSIPSPFANFDLLKSAFRWVVRNGLEGNTAQHQLISNALDIAQLFFLSQMYEEVRIVKWQISRIARLTNSPDHEDLGKTLKTYFDMDGGVYGFKADESLYLILYNEKVIGGTCPSTLFFAVPNVATQISDMNIRRKADTLFDDDYTPLHLREWSFIRYMFALRESVIHNHLPTSELIAYLNAVEQKLTNQQQMEITHIDANTLNEYNPCCITGSINDLCNISGVQLGLIMQSAGDIEKESGFVIKSTISSKKPMVLPNDVFTHKWIYTVNGVTWDGEHMKDKIPYENSGAEENSRLPVSGDQYYWLSAGNFFEDKILELPYVIDDSRFKLCNGTKYLLPIKSIFFEYFSTDDLGKMLHLTELSGGGVQARLDIPVKAGVVSFTKLYNSESKQLINLHLAILPFVKVDFPLHYTISVLDNDKRNNKSNDISIAFFKGISTIANSGRFDRCDFDKYTRSSHFGTDDCFDKLQLQFNGVAGFLIPEMSSYGTGGNKFSFAIDFGTTNTHMEYAINDNASCSINSDVRKPLWASLLKRDDNTRNDHIITEGLFEQEIVPLIFGSQSAISFPLRTAVVENQRINFKNQIELYRDVNNFFMYEKEKVSDHLNLNTSIKWGKYSDDQLIRVKKFIQGLITIAYYKTLLSNGDINATKIIWFYPISMTKFQKNALANAWHEALKMTKWTGVTIIEMSESIAPFYFYHNRKGVHGLCASIDVGGGSTDIAFFDEGNAKTMSSVRFAGNSIYGDGYGGSPSVNGFVRLYQHKAFESLEANGKAEKTDILRSIIDSRQNSADFSSFLYGISNMPEISFNYTELLQNDDMLKLPFLIFYAAIAYYIAKHLKQEGIIQVPNNFLFSGTGAKSIHILDPSPNLTDIADLYKFFIAMVLETKAECKSKAILAEFPKELTCKGGILTKNIQEGEVKQWLGGASKTEWDINFKTITTQYKDIEESHHSYIIDSVIEFYKLMDNYTEHHDITNNFGISLKAYEVFKEMREDQLIDYLKKGIEIKKEEGGAQLEESLFFYPLVGMLNRLGNSLADAAGN